MTSATKTFEQRIAALVRMLGTTNDGEKIATVNALQRLLASRNTDLTDLGDAIERLATGGLEEAAMQRIFDAGREREREEVERKLAESQAVYGLNPDGSPDWEAMALHCQRHVDRLEAKHHQFIDDMSGRLAWGSEPTEKQGKYLLSLFRQLGGRMRA